MCCGSHFHFSLRAQRGIVALQRVAWERSLLCLRVGFSFLCGSAGGWAESLSCYFLTSFATSFGRRGFKNRKPIGEVGCCESRMAERSHWWTESSKAKRVSKAKKSADRSGKYFSTPETWTVECNCRRIFANIWFSQVWKHSSYTYAIPCCFKIWAWLRHEFLETAIPWWFTSKFWPRHELGMSLSFDCNVHRHAHFLCPSLLPTPCKFLPILWKLQPDFSGMYWCISIATWSRYKWMQGQVPKDRVASSETQSFWCPLQIAWGLGSPTSIHQIAWDHPQKTSKRRLFRFSAWSSNLDHI